MSTLHNRQRSYDQVLSRSLSNGSSEIANKSNLEPTKTGHCETPRRRYSFQESELKRPSRTSFKSDLIERLSSKPKYTKESNGTYNQRLSSKNEETPRRRSSTSEFLIRAQRDEQERMSSLDALEAKLSRLSSSSTIRADRRTASSEHDSLLNFTTELNRSPSTRKASFSSTRGTSYSSQCFETRSSASPSLKSTLSGRYLSPLSSLSSRSRHDSSLGAQCSDEYSTLVQKRRNGLCGLRNVGNSCYQNSVIQLLNAIPEIVKCMRNTSEMQSTTGKLSPEMIRLFKEFWNASEGDIVDLTRLRSHLLHIDKKWMGHMQEDAHEFLTQIISALQEDYNRNTSKPKYVEMKDEKDMEVQALMEWEYCKQWNDSEIDDIFGFQLHNQVVCPACGFISNRFEYLTSLEVPLPEQAATIEDCLVEFMKAERLDRDNEWYCSKCKSHVQAAKQLRISRLPKVMILCLKRFSSSSIFSSMFRSWKNKVNIKIPEGNINLKTVLSPTVDADVGQKSEYELIGIVDHSGSVNFGHYTARIRNVQNHDWYLMNDENVRGITKPVGPSQSAYILALRQVDMI